MCGAVQIHLYTLWWVAPRIQWCGFPLLTVGAVWGICVRVLSTASVYLALWAKYPNNDGIEYESDSDIEYLHISPSIFYLYISILLNNREPKEIPKWCSIKERYINLNNCVFRELK